MTTDITVAKYMTSKPVTLKPEMDISEAIHIFIKNRVSGAPVLDDAGKLVGLFSEADCIESYLSCAYNGNAECGTVADNMTTDLTTVSADADIIEAARLFKTHRLRRMPVLNHGKLVGQISRHDILRAIHDNGWA